MRLFRRHLDTETLALSLLDRADARDAAHLAGCPPCQRRRTHLERRLTALRTAAHAEADAAFPAEALDEQRSAILQRITRSAERRVLAFPRGPLPAAGSPSGAPDRRWVAAAAAAGLLIGVAVGQVPHQWRPSPPSAAVSSAPVAPAPVVRRDDTLLSDVEEVLTLDVRPEFGALDGLTPIAYETR
jgi:anti-sigma factor RsiW